MKPHLLLVALLSFCSGLPLPAGAEPRQWTSFDGKTIAAEIVDLEGDQITLRMEGRGDMTFPLSRLGEADRKFAQEWKENAAAEKPDEVEKRSGDEPLGNFTDLKLGEWPNSVAAEFGVEQIQIVKEDKAAGEYVYRSPHFEFRSGLRLSKSVVRDFAEIFEATYAFMKAIPIGLDPQPPGDGYYPTQLFKDTNEYLDAGGMEGSAGMFTYSYRGREILDGMIKVPMTSLGVKFTGVRFVVDRQKDSDTLIHEIVHQLTGNWLPILPIWFKEGIAETVSTQKYGGGRFSLTGMDRAIREDLARRTGSDREFTMVRLERLMNMTGEEWAAALASEIGGKNNYPSANLLFFYFLRLEGEGKAEALVNYMKALAEGKNEAEARQEILMPEKSFETLEKEVATAWRSRGLRLEFR